MVKRMWEEMGCTNTVRNAEYDTVHVHVHVYREDVGKGGLLQTQEVMEEGRAMVKG